MLQTLRFNSNNPQLGSVFSRAHLIQNPLFAVDHEFLSPDASKDDHHSSHGDRAGNKEQDSQRMTNADFRKMMMTPRSDKTMTAMGALALGAGNSTLGGTTASTNAAGRLTVGGSGTGTTVDNTELSERPKNGKRKKVFMRN